MDEEDERRHRANENARCASLDKIRELMRKCEAELNVCRNDQPKEITPVIATLRAALEEASGYWLTYVKDAR